VPATQLEIPHLRRNVENRLAKVLEGAPGHMNIRFNYCFSVWSLLLVAAVMATAAPACAQTARDDFAVAANHYSRGNWSEAVEAFGELIRRHPNANESIDGQFFLAEVMMQRSEFGQAYRAFQIFLQENPEHQYAQRATFRMGEAAYRTGNHDVAVRILEEFVRKNPHDGLTEFALPYLGDMRLKREEPQLAQRAYETALKMYPASAVSNRSRLGLAKALQMLGNETESIRFYQYLLTQNDNDLLGESQLQLGIISFGKDGYPEAEEYLRAAISNCQSQHSQAEATYWLARTHNETEDYGRAIELLKTIVGVELPEKLAVAILFDGAVAATKIGNDRLALVWLSKLRESYPTHALVGESIRLAIDIHQRRGESDEAFVLIQRFRKEHKSSPMRASVLESEGRSHYAAKRYEQMIATFEILLKESGDTETGEPTDRANWHYLKSLGHLGLGDFEQAAANGTACTIG
jgi:TolA-binding protein